MPVPGGLSDRWTRRLEFAAFSVKSMPMTSGGNSIDRIRAAEPPDDGVCALAVLLVSASGRRPGSDVQRSAAAGAAGLGARRSSGRDEPGAARRARRRFPTLPAPVTQPPRCRVPPVVAAAGRIDRAGQAVLSLTARYGKDMPVINGGLVWRVFADRPDETGTFKLIREDHGATPNIVLPPGSYVVHVALGLVSAVRPVTLKSDTVRESFVLPAGGLRIEGRVGTSENSAPTRFRSRSTRAASSKPPNGHRCCRAFLRATSRCCRRAPTTSSPIMATPIRSCVRISVCRPEN